MSAPARTIEPCPLVLHMGPVLRKLSDREFYEFCRLNRELRIERTEEGDLVIMPPTGGETGRVNSTLSGLIFAWAEKEGAGITFDSSTAFSLPSGSIRSPDAAWVERSRWEVLAEEQREGFPPLCPDFVAEIRSPSDALRGLQAKMEEYLANGARLGWLIDPAEKMIHIYRPGVDPVCLEDPAGVPGDPVLPGFVLDVKRLWG